METEGKTYDERIKRLSEECVGAGHGKASVRTIEADIKWIKNNPGRLSGL